MEQVKPSFINSEREAMRRALDWTVKDLQRDLETSPEYYVEPGADEPSIDIRLWIDADSWIFRVGLSDFDPYHSAICAGSCVSLDTETDDLLEELINAALDRCAELGGGNE